MVNFTSYCGEPQSIYVNDVCFQIDMQPKFMNFPIVKFGEDDLSTYYMCVNTTLLFDLLDNPQNIVKVHVDCSTSDLSQFCPNASSCNLITMTEKTCTAVIFGTRVEIMMDPHSMQIFICLLHS